MLTEGQQRNGQLQEHLSQQLTQSLSTALYNRLERTIREELKKTIPQCECCCLHPAAQPRGGQRPLSAVLAPGTGTASPGRTALLAAVGPSAAWREPEAAEGGWLSGEYGLTSLKLQRLLSGA